MPGSDELYPPGQYGWGWILLAIGILLLLIVGAWVVSLLTRPRRDLTLTAGQQQPVLQTADVLSQLRVEYLQSIQRIEDDYRARTLSARNANLELSRVVRT